MAKRLVLVIGLFVWGNMHVTSPAQTQNQEDPRPKPAAPQVNDARFHARLLQIAQEYQKYRRVDADARLALLDCRAPSSFLGVPRLSKSTDQATHGKKVYYLYAKKQQAYRDAAKPADQRGQVVVKETWQARPIESRGPIVQVKKKLTLAAKDGDKHFIPGAAGALFVMYRNEDVRLNEATDDGWVYGTISVDRKSVSSAGRVASCMRCHRSAPHGRLFGLKDLPAILATSKKPATKRAGNSGSNPDKN